jgi:hypothetical protein
VNGPSGRARGAVVAAAAVAVTIAFAVAGDKAMAIAAGLTVLTIGMWATSALPEHLVAVIFFVLAIVLSVAPQEVVLSGFLSSALWLVFGGLVLGVAVQRTGLGGWLACGVVDRIGSSYASVIATVVIGNVVLGFLVPSAMARAVILMPIVVALAEQLGFSRGDRGRTGMVVATAVCGYVIPATILPANLPIESVDRTLKSLRTRRNSHSEIRRLNRRRERWIQSVNHRDRNGDGFGLAV